VTASLLSTLVRSDGRRQVTYNGHPLYYYANDYAAGTDYGQCLPQGAAFWYIRHASGSPNTSCV
jgi:predicted lipoprotein with Yx(FWY)xxD motif